mmetsp:Transcript_58733/g.108365  ORF Transcript_58733/g.108365 Transcript_58733/m.108365 type:complete len:666 (-) Transcript_58733:11-2008(-)
MAWQPRSRRSSRWRGLLCGLLVCCLLDGVSTTALVRQDRQDMAASVTAEGGIALVSEEADLGNSTEEFKDEYAINSSMLLATDSQELALIEEPLFDTLVGCYDSNKNKIEDCECHPSCRACGFNDKPFGPNNCLKCPDGSRPEERLWQDGGGSCSPVLLSGGCFGRGFKLPTEACECHDSCKACGFSLQPWGPSDCISCTSGQAVRQVFLEGTGTCPSRGKGVCYDLFKRPIDGCTCHESCLDCGYALSPELPHQCISCKSGTPVRQMAADGTGTCMSPEVAALPFYGQQPESWDNVTGKELHDGKVAGCYNRFGVHIKGCECHPTCLTCGYDWQPTRSTDCLTCRDGSLVNTLSSEGSGWCRKPRAPGCYNRSLDLVPGCQCHPTCRTCGFDKRPVLASNCLECHDERQLQNFDPVTGTGSCLKPMTEGCYNAALQRIPGCVCHSTCSACGYEDNPTGTQHCITCRSGEPVLPSPFRLDGTGTCGRALKGCYDLLNKELPNCTCHPSCAACGYRDSPKEASDCISCSGGFPVQVVHKRTGSHHGWKFLDSGHCNKPSEAGCYNAMAQKIQQCMCHPSCKSCGYNVDPTDKSRCISCTDGDVPLLVRPDGTGYCGKWKEWHRQSVRNATTQSSTVAWLRKLRSRAALKFNTTSASNASAPNLTSA